MADDGSRGALDPLRVEAVVAFLRQGVAKEGRADAGPDGDTARATWDILAPCTTRDDRAMWMSGVEDDEYGKQDDVWLHRSLKLRVVFMVPQDRGRASRGAAAQAQ